MRHRTAPALLTCGVALLIAGCGSSGSGGSSGTPTPTSVSSSTVAAPPHHVTGPVLHGLVKIRYENIAISPAKVTVRVGSTIKWTNYDPTDHNVTTQGSGPANFASKDIGMGGTYTYHATTAGVIRYLCTIHPASMVGTITVVNK